MKKKGIADMEQSALADYIDGQMHARRITRKQLGDKLGRSASTVSNWLNKKETIPIDLLDEIAEAIGEKNPLMLYQLAGRLAKLRGIELIRLLEHASLEDIKTIEALTRAYMESKK